MIPINHISLDYAREINAELAAARQAKRREVQAHQIKRDLAWLFALTGFTTWCVGLGCLLASCPNTWCAIGAGLSALLGIESARYLLTRR
jgi:hypothetical protein